MFGMKTIKKLQEQLASRDAQFERMDKRMKEIDDAADRRIASKENDCQDRISRKDRQMEIEREDRALEQERDELATANKIEVATSTLKAENLKLLIENKEIKKENEVMTKAFENMGFDVKDSKDMIDSLIKGLATKNTVQLISGNK